MPQRQELGDGTPHFSAPVVTDATAPALLGMSPRQFREAVTRQRIPFLKLGRRTVVLVADLREVAHRHAFAEGTRAPPHDLRNRRRIEATDIDDFCASLERLDKRDAVNAILGRLGYRLLPDDYRHFDEARPKPGAPPCTTPIAPVRSRRR